MDEAEQALNLAAKQMELAHVALQQAIGRVARADADQTSCEAQFKRADLSLEQAQTQWQSACDSAGVVAGIQDQPVLQKALEEADRAVSQADSEIRALLAKEREIQGSETDCSSSDKTIRLRMPHLNGLNAISLKSMQVRRSVSECSYVIRRAIRRYASN